MPEQYWWEQKKEIPGISGASLSGISTPVSPLPYSTALAGTPTRTTTSSALLPIGSLSSMQGETELAETNKNFQTLTGQESPDINIGPREGDYVPGKGILTPEGTYRQPAEGEQGYVKPTEEEKKEEEPSETKGLTFEKAYELFGSDFTGLHQQPDGTYLPDETAIKRLGGTPSSGEATVVQAGGDASAREEEYNTAVSNLSNLVQNGVSADPELVRQINGITAYWDQRKKEMERINESRTKAVAVMGMRYGGRYNASNLNQGFISNEENAGLARISELESKKQSAIAEATTAYRTQKFDEYAKLVDIAQKAWENEQKELTDLNKLIIDKNKEIREEALAESTIAKNDFETATKLSDALAPFIADRLTGDEQKDALTLSTLSETYNVPIEMLLGKTQAYIDKGEKYGTGDIGLYQMYKDQMIAQGREPVDLLEFLKAKKEATTIIQEKPATSAQQTVAEYAARIEQAEPILTNLEKDIVNMSYVNFAAQIRLPAALQSGAIQQYMQAASNFINAKLRRESGAVIAASEFAEARSQYLPQPGDTKEVLAQKQQNRQLVYQSMKKAAGPAFTSVADLLGGTPAPTGGMTFISPDGTQQFSSDSLSAEDIQTLKDNGWEQQ